MNTREHRPNKLNNQQVKNLKARLMARRHTRETLEQIAVDFGVTLQAVSYHAKKMPKALVYRPVGPRFDESELLRLYGLHMNQSIVARELGVPLKAVSRALARMEWKAAA